MAADTLTGNRIDWNFSREFITTNIKERFTCIIIGEEPVFRIQITNQLISFVNIEILAEAGSVNSGLDMLDNKIPDLAIVKINITDQNSIKSIRILRKQFPEISILITAKYSEPNIVRRIFMAGANGYLKQDTLNHHIGEAVCSLIAGKIYIGNNLFSPLLENIFQNSYNPEHVEDGVSQLTEKEFELFLLIGQGFRNQEIAREMEFSVSSVITYIKKIRLHFGFTRTPELIDFAVSWIKTYVEI